ncbi:MAG: formylmethanofuran dehydrogenase subunit A, partial [Euryarchaeota archaeon]|nr:formylmethanofuran dehydrogenase subunit A [Euryarchaeota archaeon]
DPGRDYKKVEEAFGSAFLTLKDGKVVVKDGRVAAEHMGRTYWVNAQVDPDLEREVLKDVEYNFKRYYSVNLNNYPVQERYMHKEEEVRIDASDIG